MKEREDINPTRGDTNKIIHVFKENSFLTIIRFFVMIYRLDNFDIYIFVTIRIKTSIMFKNFGESVLDFEKWKIGRAHV